ncbi:MAG: hypothetical protein GY943_08210 [Chloroflexi bacterium]|nr:hypothetical protein [Chloroflexota bacterium]
MKATTPKIMHADNQETAVFPLSTDNNSVMLWTESPQLPQNAQITPCDLEFQAHQHLCFGNIDAAVSLFETLWERYLAAGNLSKMQETMQKIIIIASPEISERYGRIRAALKPN